MVSMHASTANHNGQGFPLSAHRTGRAGFPHPALGRASQHGMHRRSSRRLGRDAKRLLELSDHLRSCQADANLLVLLSSRHASNQGSFPPRRFAPAGPRGTMSPSDFPRGSTLSMERGRRALAARDLPCCPVCCVGVPRPLPRRANPGSSVGCSGTRCSAAATGGDSGGLPGYSGRSALATSLSRPAQASRMLRPVDSLTHPWWASVPRASTWQLPVHAVLIATGVSRRLPRQDLHL